MARTNKTVLSPEIEAINTVYAALRVLDAAAQVRVLRYSAEMLGLSSETANISGLPSTEPLPFRTDDTPSTRSGSSAGSELPEDVDGINPVALKWMKRSGLNAQSLQKLFSLGIDDIDLVAKSVPGTSKRERMRNVILLKGVAAYLGTGVPRITYEQLREACLHYNAYDVANFARHLKSFAADVGGTKEAGLTLTARGLTAATDIVKELLTSKP